MILYFHDFVKREAMQKLQKSVFKKRGNDRPGGTYLHEYMKCAPLKGSLFREQSACWVSFPKDFI